MTIAENYILDTYHREPYSKRGVFDLKAVDERRRPGRQGLRHPDAVDPDVRRRRSPAATSRRSSSRASSPCRSSSSIAAQPTRGLDVGSIEYIHRRIIEQRDAGAAILIVSTELDEVLAVGDRIAVMFDGRIVGILDGDDATYENLGLLMGGAAFGDGGVARMRRVAQPAATRPRPDPGRGHGAALRRDRDRPHRLQEPVAMIGTAIPVGGNRAAPSAACSTATARMLTGAFGDPGRIGDGAPDRQPGRHRHGHPPASPRRSSPPRR